MARAQNGHEAEGLLRIEPNGSRPEFSLLPLQGRHLLGRRDGHDAAGAQKRDVAEAVRRRFVKGLGGGCQGADDGIAVVRREQRGGTAGGVIAGLVFGLEDQHAPAGFGNPGGGGGAGNPGANHNHVEHGAAKQRWVSLAARESEAAFRRSEL